MASDEANMVVNFNRNCSATREEMHSAKMHPTPEAQVILCSSLAKYLQSLSLHYTRGKHRISFTAI